MAKTSAKSAAAKPADKLAARTSERRQVLKLALIDAAEKAIATQGLAGLAARDLAREVGCALGAIYNVFPDLDSIVYQVNSRTLASFEAFLAARDRPRPGEGADGDRAVTDLVDLAIAYLDFAVANQPRWRALFEHHRSTPDAGLPEWYLADQRRMFMMVEKPLGVLRPDLSGEQRILFACTIFSAVHGVVSLGLDEKLTSLSVAALSQQVRAFVESLGKGLASGGSIAS